MPGWYVLTELPAPHPVLGCRHMEGAIVEDRRILRWLPAVHDCATVDARNRALAAGRPLPVIPVRPLRGMWG